MTATWGLSPRVRGNRSSGGRAAIWAGSIPACAGEPRALARRKQIYRVYPRVCGGTHHMKEAELLAKGLSPRVRGNRKHSKRSKHGNRSIPACAGEPG